MNTRIFFGLIMVCLSIRLASQGFQADAAEAERLFSSGQYASAIRHFEALILAGKANGNTYYKAGRCYLQSRSLKQKAAPLLEKALSESTSFYTHALSKESDAPMDVFYYLGEAYRYQFEFEKAAMSFEKYKARLQDTKTITDKTQRELDDKIANSRLEAEMKDNFALPPNITLAGMFDSSKPLGEFSSGLSADKTQMIFTLRVPVSQLRKNADDRYYEDEKIAAVKSEQKLSKKTSDLKLQQDTVINITTVGTSSDGQVMLIYRNDRGEAGLYSQRLSGNDWSPPVRVPKQVNQAGWEFDEYVTADGNTMFFVSDRNGGYGGKDIYRCDKMANGQWSKAKNLGPEINSSFDETAPFMHSDNETFYFSSNRLHPANAFDIYRISRKGGKWSNSAVCGYPVNSNEQNLFYQVQNKNKLTALKDEGKSSKQPAVASEKLVKNLTDSADGSTDQWRDNYVLSLTHEESGASLLLRSNIRGGNNKLSKAVTATVSVIEAGTGRLLQQCISDSKGVYALLLPDKPSLLVYEAEGYLPQTEFFEAHKKQSVFRRHETVLLPLKEEGARITLQSVNFKDEQNEPDKKGFAELAKVVSLIKQHPDTRWVLVAELQSPFRQQKHLAANRAEQLYRMLKESGVPEKKLKVKSNFKRIKADPNKDDSENNKQSYILVADEIQKNK